MTNAIRKSFKVRMKYTIFVSLWTHPTVVQINVLVASVEVAFINKNVRDFFNQSFTENLIKQKRQSEHTT